MRYIVLLAILLAGCTSMVPYAEFGLGWQMDKETDWYSRTDRPWQCSNPFVFFGAGLELKSNWSVGVEHESHIQCGWPTNSKPETYSLDVRVTKRIGGRK